jgi:Protein of unknown function (DUF1593)/Ca-dependent carbohydrate-binding module xylan-binding
MAKSRVFISTDAQMATGINNIDGDKDDIQSLVHALLYQDKLDIRGFTSTTSRWQPGKNDAKFIHHVIDAYAKDEAKLKANADGFKSASDLHDMVYQGTKTLAGYSGIVGQTAGSNAIVKEARAAEAAGEKLYVVAWGGTGDVARALYDAPDIKDTVRLISIYDQEPNANKWLDSNFVGKGGWWVDVMSSFNGTFATPTSRTPIPQSWATENAKGHGALGELLYQNTFDIRGTSGTHNGVKMGDSNSIFYLIDSANNDDPTINGWGGKYRQVKDGYWTDLTDGAFSFSGSNGSKYIYEDRAAWMGDFAKRLDWLKGTAAPLPPQEPASPADPVAPTTDDALQIRISGDASSAGLDPTVIILVDGVKKGTFAVTADHADGEWQTIAIDGTWKAGVNHKVEVKFYERASSQAVYVDSVTLNGDVNGTNATMLTSGNKLYWVGDDAL